MAASDTPYLIPTSDAAARQTALVGGKAAGIARLAAADLPVVSGLAVTVRAYHDFIAASGLSRTLDKLVTARDFRAMRWEAVWDTSLEIRNRFNRAQVPDAIREAVTAAMDAYSLRGPVALRSSASSEDAAGHSFAGLHDSFLDLADAAAVADHLPLLFASLWSDRALLYRSELGLDPAQSAMAGLIQPMRTGPATGICFTKSPMDERRLVVEAHAGPGIELVSGQAEPARWIVDRESRAIVEQTGADSPLPESTILDIASVALGAESVLGAALDMEWIVPDDADGVRILQARPITALPGANATENGDAWPWEREDRRPWDMSLHRSFGQLKELRRRVEALIPDMEEDARQMRESSSKNMDNDALADEIERRLKVYQDWNDRYYEEFVPLAHAVRLFGQVYNDQLAPDDPFAFRDLLTGERLAGLARNEQLEDMADMLRADETLRDSVARGEFPESSPLQPKFLDFIDAYGDLTCHIAWCSEGEAAVLDLLVELAKRPRRAPKQRDITDAEQDFLRSFPESQQDFATELLDLARAAYRLRDDDNMALGRVEAAMLDAVEDGRQRLHERFGADARRLSPQDTARSLRDPQYVPACIGCEEPDRPAPSREASVVRGQPAGPGIARGPARIVRSREDMYALKNGEVLVCDSVDPAMTFAAPLAAAIVERRGGMLVHGAIIAREYGLPCVTGVNNATEIFEDGEVLIVNGEDGTVRRAAGEPA